MARYDSLKKLTRWLPMIGAAYPVYEQYATRGLQGFIDDVNAISGEGLKSKIKTIAVGAGLIVAARPASNYLPVPSLRPVLAASMYYFGMKNLMMSLEQGAAASGRGGARSGARSGSGRMYVPASSGVNITDYKGVQ